MAISTYSMRESDVLPSEEESQFQLYTPKVRE
jgi:hypothetical protein